MRLSSSMIYNANLNQMMTSQQKMYDAVEQVSTGKKINAPSDDASGSSQATRLSETLQKNEQYRTNGTQAASNLALEEAALDAMDDTLNRVNTLLMQANNGAFDDDDRLGMAVELKGIQQEMVALANTQDLNGHYIFSGTANETPTYILNGAGEYEYQGTQQQNSIAISDGVDVQLSDTGFTLFESGQIYYDAQIGTPTGGATAVNVSMSNQDAFARFAEGQYDAITPANNVLSIATTAGTPDTYQITDAGGTVLQSGNYTSGEAINFNGLNIDLEGTAPSGASVTLQPPEQRNMLNVMTDMINLLQDPNKTVAEIGQASGKGMQQLRMSQDQMLTGRAAVGARMNQIDAAATQQAKDDEIMSEIRAGIVEVDLAEAATELTKHETQLQAAYGAYSKVSSLTLFDFL